MFFGREEQFKETDVPARRRGESHSLFVATPHPFYNKVEVLCQIIIEKQKGL